jgi:hypothetical protein
MTDTLHIKNVKAGIDILVAEIEAMELPWEEIDGDIRVDDEGDSYFCPLTALYYKRTGKFDLPENASDCAEKMGIPLSISDPLINGADYVSSPWGDELDRYARSKLLFLVTKDRKER